MTAEIGLMNRLGVALAADSAITLGGEDGKIYASADKLFQLSLSAPVGAMTYGNASLVDIPWETVVKTYRKQGRNNTFDTIEGYAYDFIKFLKRRREMFSRSLQRITAETWLNLLFRNVCDEIWKKLKEKEKVGKKISEKEIRETVADVVQETLAIVRKWEIPSGLPKNIQPTLRKKLRGWLLSIKRKSFKDLPMTAAASRNLTTIALEGLTRCLGGSYESGIVIAGFGEKEYSPILVEIMVDGMIEGRLKYSVRETHKIDDKTISCVIPFAQREMVYTFMEGIDPRLQNIIYNSTASIFSGVTNVIIDKVKNHDAKFGRSLAKEVNASITKLLDDLFSRWNQERKKSHWGPITEIVSSLPKDELAAMAESLVNLTKFRRRVSPEKETVGGPIDVAVITKGDGFIWVKRKQYFDPKVNPRTIGRYFKEAAYNGKA